jgi:hypothetical protein
MCPMNRIQQQSLPRSPLSDESQLLTRPFLGIF